MSDPSLDRPWRVLQMGLVVASFDTESEARDFADADNDDSGIIGDGACSVCHVPPDVDPDADHAAGAPEGHISWSDDTHAYVACCYGTDGDEPGDCYTRHGEDEAGQWWVDDGDDAVRLATTGPYESEAAAIEAAEALAAEQDEGRGGEDADALADRLLEERAGTPDPRGAWCVYWHTAGDDAHVVDRYATDGAAEAAAELANKQLHRAHPGGHLLCGHEVRELVDGQWVLADDHARAP